MPNNCMSYCANNRRPEIRASWSDAQGRRGSDVIAHSEIIALAIFPWVMDEDHCGHKMKNFDSYQPCSDQCECMKNAREAASAALERLWKTSAPPKG